MASTNLRQTLFPWLACSAPLGAVLGLAPAIVLAAAFVTGEYAPPLPAEPWGGVLLGAWLVGVPCVGAGLGAVVGRLARGVYRPSGAADHEQSGCSTQREFPGR